MLSYAPTALIIPCVPPFKSRSLTVFENSGHSVRLWQPLTRTRSRSVGGSWERDL